MKSKKSFMLMLFLFSFLLITTPSMASVVNFDFVQNSASNLESDFVIIEPSSPTTDDDVLCRAFDGDSYFFAWLVNGITAESNSVNATSLTLDSSETFENGILTCIIYLDSDHSIELGSKSVIVASEHIPEPPSKDVKITPSEAYTDDDLICDVVTDNDLYYYVWQVNGITILTEQSSNKTSTLQSSYTKKHDSVKCIAYYDESHTFEVGEDTVEILNSDPVAVLKVNTTSALVYEDILFDASDSYDIDGDKLTYKWDFGDGTKSTAEQVVHSYSKPGEYEVQLTVSDGESSDSDSEVITIQVPPSKDVEITPSIAYTDDDLVCDVVTDNDLYYYVWQRNGITILTEQSSKKTSTLQSSYTAKHDSVKCIAYYDESHTFEAGDDTVEILNSKPVAVLEVNTTSALVYEDILFDASDSYDIDGDKLTYKWDFGDGSTSTEKQAVHSYSEPGEYEVILHVSDDESSDYDSEVITIQVPPSKDVEITPSEAYTDDDLVCDVVTDDDSYYYVWQIDDETILTEDSPKKTSTLSSSYTEKHDSVKCIAYYYDTYDYKAGEDTVEILNSDPVAVLKVNTTSALVYEDILFDASASYDPDDDDLTYSWDFGDGSTSTAEQAVHSYSEPGEYEVILHVSDDESSDSESEVITISGNLVIQDAECFDPVMLGAKQVCSVVVVDNSGNAVGNSTVEIFDSSNNLLASCTTDSISGGCSANFTASELGENKIKIIASKEGYGSSEPEFLTFNVLKQRYELYDFSVFNDTSYSKEDDTFYRGENLYTRFRVYDLIEEEYVSEDIVTSASLVSYDAGGNIDLEIDEEADSPDSDYFHFTTKIPLTHFFIGDSAVFAFAINFSDESMGQANKNVEILNNPPEIIKDFPDITFTKITQTETIDLTDYATDLEDPDDLAWKILSYDSDLLDLELNDSILKISPAAYTKATTYIDLTVYDLDKDSASSTIKVILNIEEQECTPGETRRCGPSTNKGICEYGLQTCTADGYWGECLGAVYPREEIENDLDDDCDGEIDEGFYDFNEAVQFTRVEVFPLTGNEIEPSSIIAVRPHLYSKSSSTFKDVRAVAYLVGTDSRSLKTNFDIRKDRDNSVMLYLEIPPYVQKGDYLIKITISNDNLHMTKFVPIIIS